MTSNYSMLLSNWSCIYHYRCSGASYHVSPTTAGRIVQEACNAIWDRLLVNSFMTAPTTEGWRKVADDFKTDRFLPMQLVQLMENMQLCMLLTGPPLNTTITKALIGPLYTVQFRPRLR